MAVDVRLGGHYYFGELRTSFIPATQRYFAYYVWIGSFLAVAVSVLVTVFVLEPLASQLTQAALIYCIVVVCGLVGLRVKQAFYAVILGGIAGTLLIWVVGKEVNWILLHRTYTASSMLGLVLAYHVERLDRESFLKARLLQIINEKTEEHAGRLDKLSRQDGLTGLANRRHFDEIFQEEWARAVRQQYPITLLMIDIDHFKHYNDTLGHVRGDGCLRKVASIIAAHARRPGDLAVRYGGEEFLLFFPNMEKMKACQQAERLVQSFQEARMQQAPGLNKEFLSVSVGVATVVPGSAMVEASELVCAADDALYEAKHAGRNGWRYAAGIGEAHDTSASA